VDSVSWDLDQFHAVLTEEWGRAGMEQVMPTITMWLARGDGAAVYQNRDLGDPERGALKVVSYGSPAAQLETGSPPARLPDIGRDINWRYSLIGTYRPSPS
jgi:hypothetical protein